MPKLRPVILPLPTQPLEPTTATPLDPGLAPTSVRATTRESNGSLAPERLAEVELDTVGDGLQVRQSEATPERRQRMNGAAWTETRSTGRPGPASRPAETHGSSGAQATVQPRPAEAAPPDSEQADGPPAAPYHADTPPVLAQRTRQRRGRQLRFLRDPRVKRAIDIAGSVTLLGALSPVLGACALAVRLSSPGPILFRQRRIGRQGQPFEILKFRTMQQNADQSAHQRYVASLIAGTADAHDADGASVFKIVGDQRITPAGHWLRHLSLDELPQLINVLRGDMSLVGPRPPLPYEVEHYTPRHHERLAVTPGITGLWQVSGRSRTTFEEMIDLDLAYIKRWSVSLDFQILLRTIPVVVFPDGH